MIEQFIEETDKIRYERTETVEPYGEVTVQIYLTKDYLDSTDKRIVESYLNNAVTDILTRNGAVRGELPENAS
jgi:hypothetical protein